MAGGMVIMESPRHADTISSPKKGDRAPSKASGGSTKKKAVGSPNLRPPPKYEMREDWPVEGPIDLNQVSTPPLRCSAYRPSRIGWSTGRAPCDRGSRPVER